MIRKNKNILDRSRILKKGKRGDGPLLYWMTRDFRIEENWALLFTQQEALIRQKAITILIALDPNFLKYPGPQDSFLLRSLSSLIDDAKKYNLGVAIITGKEEEEIPLYCRLSDCNLLVTDFLPLRQKKEKSRIISQHISVPFIEVDSHNIIPAWLISEKKEYGAYTLRPKVNKLLPQYLTEIPDLQVQPEGSLQEIDIPKLKLPSLLESLNISEHELFPSGRQAGLEEIDNFLSKGLEDYAQLRNDPTVNGQSNLSPYLHFGLLSPQGLALKVSRSSANDESKKTFLEELIVRRELSDNFCLYEPDYDSFKGFHPWAQKSLNEHREDKRQYCYTKKEFEDCATHESLWNSCQFALMNENKLHGFLRMYWAKKILEWSASPEDALDIAIYLNDKYSLDGNDPNGYTGIAWSIGGIHDRAWQEREIFGKVRYMNERGCRRKFDVEKYISENSPN